MDLKHGAKQSILQLSNPEVTEAGVIVDGAASERTHQNRPVSLAILLPT